MEINKINYSKQKIMTVIIMRILRAVATHFAITVVTVALFLIIKQGLVIIIIIFRKLVQKMGYLCIKILQNQIL